MSHNAQQDGSDQATAAVHQQRDAVHASFMELARKWEDCLAYGKREWEEIEYQFCNLGVHTFASEQEALLGAVLEDRGLLELLEGATELPAPLQATLCGYHLVPVAVANVLDAFRNPLGDVLPARWQAIRNTLPGPPRFDGEARRFWFDVVVQRLKQDQSQVFAVCSGEWKPAEENVIACRLLANVLGACELPAAPAVKKKLKRGEAFKQAVLVLAQNPEWTVEQIADQVGCSHSTLYRNTKFKELYKPIHETGSLPKGFFQERRDGEHGNIDALEDE